MQQVPQSMTQLSVLNDAAVTGNQTELFIEYPEQTIKRLTHASVARLRPKRSKPNGPIEED
jgi:hypothetical protein